MKDIAGLHGLKFGGLNVRSLIRKMDDVHVLLDSSQLLFLGITESWLNFSITDAEVIIPGFNMFRLDHDEGHAIHGGGGIVVYAKQSHRFTHVIDLDVL